MFSSLASFLFGSNTNCETNSETTATATATGASDQRDTDINSVDADNFIEVTSRTPSVTGAGAGDRGQVAIKRGKGKHNKRKGYKAPLPPTAKPATLQTPPDSSDFDEDDWLIVEKEEDKEDFSPIGTDSEGKIIAVVDVAETTKPVNAVAASSQQQRFQHINSHSLYSGPRPQKQRNFLHKTRNNTSNRPGKGLSVSTLSPSRTVSHGRIGSDYEAAADSGVTHSLYVAPTTSSQSDDEKPNNAIPGIEIMCKMDESWFLTPPPCFTSIGPINMETSPYENLLIEHPSMSVYRSIRSAQEASESFTKLDVSVSDKLEEQKSRDTAPEKVSQAIQLRPSSVGYHLDRQSVAILKQELMARNEQKVLTKRERRDNCRSAIQRANKVRDIQSRNHTKRRSDNQHSKIFSYANNNRKTNCC